MEQIHTGAVAVAVALDLIVGIIQPFNWFVVETDLLGAFIRSLDDSQTQRVSREFSPCPAAALKCWKSVRATASRL